MLLSQELDFILVKPASLRLLFNLRQLSSSLNVCICIKQEQMNASDECKCSGWEVSVEYFF